MILAIDSSQGTSVALVGQTRVVAEAASADTRAHAEEIGLLIARVFSEAHAVPADVTLVAAGVGPGPFTGLRVGLAAARAFAVARGIPEVGVMSHDAVALEWLERHYARARTGLAEFAPAATVATDARRKQLFVSAYSGLDAHLLPVRLQGPAIVEASAATDDWVRPAAVSAGFLGLVAWRRETAGVPQESTAPQYLREPDVRPPSAPKRVLS